jgi:sarcosine oxidase
MKEEFDVVVIGAGVNGLATAYHLSKQAGLKIGLIEQFRLGHARGSSHGHSRIFRPTYTNPVYAKLALHRGKVFLGKDRFMETERE